MFSMTFFFYRLTTINSFRVLTDREFASFSLVMEGAPIQIQTIEAF